MISEKIEIKKLLYIKHNMQKLKINQMIYQKNFKLISTKALKI